VLPLQPFWENKLQLLEINADWCRILYPGWIGSWTTNEEEMRSRVARKVVSLACAGWTESQIQQSVSGLL
jgi:hypothetical protein